MKHFKQRRGRDLVYRFNWRMDLIFKWLESEQGKSGLKHGRYVERSVDQAFRWAKEKQELPTWLLGWTRHEPYSAMDTEHVDFSFHTTRGDVLVQIKSSAREVARFERKYKNLGIIAIAIIDPDDLAGNYKKILKPVEIQWLRRK